MISYGLYIIAILSLVFNLVRITGVSIPDATFLAAFIFVFLEEGILKKQPVRYWLPSHPLIPAAFLILMGGILSSINATSLSTSIGITLKQFYIFTIFTCMGVFMARQMKTDHIVSALICGGIITSIAALNDYILGYKFSNELLMSLGSIPLNESWDRYSGLLGHPNEQAMFLAVLLPLELSRLLDSFNKRMFDSILNSFILLILVIALFLTGSVSGYFSAVVSSIICIILFFHSQEKEPDFIHNLFSRLLIGGFLTITVMALLFNTQLGSKLSISGFFANFSITDYLFRSLDRVVTTTSISRWDDFVLGFKYITNNPLLGAGMDQGGTGGLDSTQMVTQLAIHNTILQSWVTGGLLTFFGTLTIYWFVIKISIRSLFENYINKTYPLLIGFAASSIGFVIIDMTSSNIYQRTKWLIFAILLGLISRENGNRNNYSTKKD